MLSSEEFKKFTGVAREATLEEMVIQLTKKVVQENNGLIGQALLSHELINTYGWKVSQGAHVTGLTPNQVRSAANRGAILTQCAAAHVPSVYASLRACSSERTITLHKECLAIMDSGAGRRVRRQCSQVRNRRGNGPREARGSRRHQ
jgi:hypothetical protein